MWIGAGEVVRIMAIALLAGACVYLWRKAIQPPGNDTAPHRIFSLQFARKEARAKAIIVSWKADKTLAVARLGVWWDFVFLLTYATLGALWCRWAATWALAGGWAVFSTWTATWAAWMMIAAALFDAVEDAATLALLYGSEHAVTPAVLDRAEEETLPGIMTLCATIKFALLGVAIGSILICLVLRFV